MPLGYRARQTSHGPVSLKWRTYLKSPYTPSPPLPLSLFPSGYTLGSSFYHSSTLYWVYSFTSYTWHTHLHPIDYNIVSTTNWHGGDIGLLHTCAPASLSLSLLSPSLPPSSFLLPLTHSYKLCHRRGLLAKRSLNWYKLCQLQLTKEGRES